jgi:LuxR family maltose regulon positive regulatory protein
VSALADLDDLLLFDELWAYVLHARALYALLWADRQSSIDELDEVRQERNPRRGRYLDEGVAGSLVAADTANLLIAQGRGNQAMAVLENWPRPHPALDVARARAALLAGDNERALVLAHALGSPSIPPSALQRLEVLLIESLAHYRLGNTERAVDGLLRALRRSRELGTWLPIIECPRAEVLELAGLLPDAQGVVDLEALAHAPEPFPPKIALVTLSDRERAVLDELAYTAQVRAIATALDVSVNTVKTQLRSLYHKLGVTSREQALAAAAQLRPPSGPAESRLGQPVAEQSSQSS